MVQMPTTRPTVTSATTRCTRTSPCSLRQATPPPPTSSRPTRTVMHSATAVHAHQWLSMEVPNRSLDKQNIHQHYNLLFSLSSSPTQKLRGHFPRGCNLTLLLLMATQNLGKF